MSFKFNFLNDANTTDVKEHAGTKSATVHGTKEAKEIKGDYSQIKLEAYETDVINFSDSSKLTYISSHKESQHSNVCDLVPAVYEGGLKIWECAKDLTQFLHSENIALRGLDVLEVGCGGGLPGMYAILHGATVHFQDFNHDVLEERTIPNIYLNKLHENCECRYFSGDWHTVCDLLQSLSLQYDVILTAETIYNTENYAGLVRLLHTVLKPDGTIYLAAKSHYFGVGGGTHLFTKYLKQHSTFIVSNTYTLHDNLNREILTIKKEVTSS